MLGSRTGEIPTNQKYASYKKIRNTVNALVKADRDMHRKNILKSFKGNPKKFYGFMRSVQTVKCKVARLKRADGSLTSDDSETAQVLCNYFGSVFVKENVMPDHPADMQQDSQNEPEIQFSYDSVHSKLVHLQESKSMGPDGVHPIVLKRCADVLATPLSMIFQKSYAEGKIPNDWKLADISPIFKKGSKSEPGNYRPISLTSVVSKVMESIIKEEITDVLTDRDWISHNQHGFTHGRSCLTNLLETLEAWTRLLDEGFGIDVVFLDYRKAFDSVPHKRLLNKIRALGLGDKVTKWIEDFLTERKMRVNVGGNFSTWLEVLSGVPQGSVLGPLLFLLFVNDLPDWVQCSIKMFADDTKIWTKISMEEDQELLQNDLNQLIRWSQEWLLQFNPEKCKVMHIGHTLDTTYWINDQGSSHLLQETDSEKDLGVYISKDLKPSLQCATAANKAMTVLRMIKRNFTRIDCEDFRILYHTYVRPHMEYCVQVWNPHLRKDIDCLEKIQRRATKMVWGLSKRTYADRLCILGLYTLERRRLRGDLIEMFKMLTGREGISYEQFFTLASTQHSTRGHSLKLYKERSRLDCRKYSFSQRSVDVWNSLPSEVINATSVNSFKNRLDSHWSDVGT